MADKSWALASSLEVTPEPEGLATMEEKTVAAKHALLQQKLA